MMKKIFCFGLVLFLPFSVMAQKFEAENQQIIGKTVVEDDIVKLCRNGDGISIPVERGKHQIIFYAQSTYGIAELDVSIDNRFHYSIMIPDTNNFVPVSLLLDGEETDTLWQFTFSNDYYIYLIADRNIFLDYIVIADLDTMIQTLIATWDANVETDLSGYKIYYGDESRIYSKSIDVGNVIEYIWSDIWTANVTYYFAVTAYDSTFNESDFSDEVSLLMEKNVKLIPPHLIKVIKFKF